MTDFQKIIIGIAILGTFVFALTYWEYKESSASDLTNATNTLYNREAASR